MSNPSLVDQLDQGIDALLLRSEGETAAFDPAVLELLAVADTIRATPSYEFKARLKSELLDRISSGANAIASEGTDVIAGATTTAGMGEGQSIRSEILPTLSGSANGLYPVQRSSFMTSLGAHAAFVALLVTSGIWAAPKSREGPRVHSVIVTDIGAYTLAPAPGRAGGGGGGGGDADKLQASKGAPPRFDREQITPPAIVVRNEQPRLPAEPTVVGPPNISFPQMSETGDPFSRVTGPQSNGTGSASGIGSGSRGGVGRGNGPGVGEGNFGGFGGGPYRVGGNVSAPRAIYDPEPQYSDEARKQKYQGIVILQVVVGSDGLPRDVRIARSLGLGLDEQAVEAVRQWRFEPGRMDGKAVAVMVNIEVNFRLY